jgi:carbon monoxide dehydrogenase subunit G
MRMQHAIEIERTPAQVWPWLTEPERMKQWMKGLLEVTFLSEGEQGVGSRARFKIKEGRRISDYEDEVILWEPPHRLGIRMWGGALPEGQEIHVAYEVVDFGARSRVEVYTTCELKGAWKLFAPLLKLFAGMQQKSFFRALRKHAEAEAG